MIRSIRVRINLYYGLTLFFVILAVFFFLQIKIENYLLAKIRNELKTNVQLLDKLLKKEIQSNLTHFNRKNIYNKKLSQKLKKLKKSFLSYRITVILNDGFVLSDSDSDKGDTFENHRYRTEIVEAKKNTFGTSIRFSESLSKGMLYFAYYNGRYVLRIARLLNDVDAETGEVRKLIFIIGILLLIIFLIINMIIAWYITKPVKELIHFTKTYRKGKLDIRVPVKRDDEIGILQTTVNDMAENMEHLVHTIESDRQRLENVISTIDEALVLVGPDEKISLVNKVFKAIFPVSGKYQEQPYYQVIKSNGLNQFIEEGLKGKKIKTMELELVRLEETIIEATILPVEKDEGILVIIRDITSRKKFETQKSDFFANASHELKTPLSIVKGYVETLIDRNNIDSSTRNTFMNKINRNITRLEQLVNDIATLNKLEEGSKYYSKSESSVTEIIERVILSLSIKAKEAAVNISFTNHMKSGLCLCNVFTLESLFFNLIDNALKYNIKAGKIEVIANENESDIVINVVDTGRGFTAQEKDRLFERFYRTDPGRAEEGGTGLGLAIAKHAALSHNGSIEASSEGPGKGSTFTVNIPKK